MTGRSPPPRSSTSPPRWSPSPCPPTRRRPRPTATRTASRPPCPCTAPPCQRVSPPRASPPSSSPPRATPPCSSPPPREPCVAICVRDPVFGDFSAVFLLGWGAGGKGSWWGCAESSLGSLETVSRPPSSSSSTPTPPPPPPPRTWRGSRGGAARTPCASLRGGAGVCVWAACERPLVTPVGSLASKGRRFLMGGRSPHGGRAGRVGPQPLSVRLMKRAHHLFSCSQP
mmetsp:Transcript_54473/g.133163  ORF Transcript_54473/g.133163 Transcript_54473/m.133163 type:complete len:228 (-) Transcript_54473:24-707(-)